ncbi:hypothetical protein CK203_041400 [Vitis vinifera]|uniref:Uncharacterized protein n=1 Tax=Vitis vinifera TaxID=29760 RepID=A0A438H5U3_VITVI|nr:hypothetical protein CK203_041400 [Vitis vinifera]
MERGIREGLSFAVLSRNSKRCSREETSTSSGEVDPRNSHFEEDKEGFLGRVGSENMEVCLPFPSQPPESSSIPSCSLELPLLSPSGVVGTFYQKYVGIPVRDEEENQFALSNQLSESFTPRKSKPSSPKEDSNLLTGSQGILWYPIGDFLLMACPPGKWLKCERFYALWILRFIPGGRTVAPQVIETWWIWFGGLGSVSFSMKIISWNTGVWVQGISEGNGWEGHKFMRRLQSVKAKLKEWNKVSFGELNEKKKSILNDLANFDAIEQVGGLTSDLLNQRALRKRELEELILREEIHWRQKARVKWVKEGDCNSKGDLYFEKLYASPIGESWRVEGLDWSPISEESVLRLDSPFTEEEISKAIFQLDRDKASGPDGFTIAVFQDCWM